MRPSILEPTRFTGDASVDMVSLIQWLTDFYKAVVLLNQDCTGTATVSEDETDVEVTSIVRQTDVNYRIAVTATESTGTPADAAFIVKAVAKTKTGFTLTLAAAPGSGNTVTFDWQIQR